ncbi:MAG: hypothetical protein E6G76_05080 [Alphaproteobacteria bacterium]|nr:MAG: hypothetical protein E6G76_05080 [Alphaproteobacteria bacterium]
MNPKIAAVLKRIDGIERQRGARRPLFIAYGPGEDPQLVLQRHLAEHRRHAGRPAVFINTGVSRRLRADVCTADSLRAALSMLRGGFAAIWRTSVARQRKDTQEAERELIALCELLGVEYGPVVTVDG